MRIAITGTAGQIASYLAEHYLDKHDVIGIDRRKCKIRDVGKITVKGDINEIEKLRKVIKGADVVVHAAAQVSVSNSWIKPWRDAQDNIIGTIKVAEMCGREDAKIIYLSSAATYGTPKYLPIDEKHPTEPESPYGLSKLVGEKYIQLISKEYGNEYVIVRIFNVYSSRQNINNPYSGVISVFIGRAKKRKNLIIYGDGEQTRDFIHINDVIKFVDLCIEKGKNCILNCGTGKATSIKSLASKIIFFSNKSIECIHEEARIGDIRHSVADVRLAKKVLSFEPKIDINTGLRKVWDETSQ